MQWRDIATIANKKGLDGGLVLNIGTDPSLRISEGMELFAVPPQTDAPRCLHVLEVHPASATSCTAFFEEVQDAHTAEKLIGCHCLADASLFCTPVSGLQGEGGEADALIGWAVEDTLSGFRGTVVDAQDRFEQILLSVEGRFPSEESSGSAKLIPLTDSITVEVCADERLLVLECPPGLLEL